MISRAERIYSDYPDLVKGYELNTERGLFSVIIPEATTNLVLSPSFEIPATAIDGYLPIPLAGTITVVSTWQAHGAYGLQITPTASTLSGVLYGNIGFTFATTTGVTYTASVTLQGEAGKMYYISFGGGGTSIGTPRLWIGTGHKQRIWVTYTETAGGNRQVLVYRDAKYADTNYFYVDGFQVEAKSYPTTYCDGDQVGFITGELAYFWNGVPHVSTSTRSAQTRSGGKEMNLLNFGLRVLAVIGLGMSPLVDRSLTIPGLGEVPQETGTMAREFTIIGAVDSIAGQRNLKELRSGLIDAFKPDLTVNDQPMILRYQEYDGDEVCGESLDIICKYRGGLEGQWDNNHGERLALNFKMYLPLIQSTFSKGAALGFQTTVADADYILMRDVNGTWQEMANGLDGSSSAIVEGQDGLIYVGGSFTFAGGVANTSRIASWNGTAWAPLATGMNDAVLDLVVGADGLLYAGGAFTLASGVANTDGIAYWNGAGWFAMGTGVSGGVAPTVWALAAAPDGSIYAGGNFTQMGGVAGTARIAKWSGGAWQAMGTGIDDGTVYAIAVAPNGYVYVVGSFTAVGGVQFNNIAIWNGTAWSRISFGGLVVSGVGLNNTGWAVYVAPSGLVYVGGEFTVAGLTSSPRIAIWNGSNFLPVGSGLDNVVYTIVPDKNGLIYMGGEFTATNDGQTFPDSAAVWNGTNFGPLDVNLPGAAQFLAMRFDRYNRAYLGFTTSGNATSATVEVPNVGSALVYPRITFTGPGSLWQLKNYTTGKAIYFDLTLLAGETAILDLNPMRMSFVSSFRGNIFPTILPGSNLDFELLPGTNNVSSYFYGSTTGDTAIVIDWREQYWSLDGAAWK